MFRRLSEDDEDEVTEEDLDASLDAITSIDSSSPTTATEAVLTSENLERVAREIMAQETPGPMDPAPPIPNRRLLDAERELHEVEEAIMSVEEEGLPVGQDLQDALNRAVQRVERERAMDRQRNRALQGPGGSGGVFNTDGEQVWAIPEPPPLSSSSGTWTTRVVRGPGGRNTMMRQMMEYSFSDGPKKKAPAPKKLTKSREAELHQIRDRMLNDTRGLRSGANAGHREAEYINLLRSKRRKNLSAYEIMQSEIPMLLDRIPNQRLNEINNMGLPYILDTDDGRMYVCKTCNTKVQYYFAMFCIGNLYCVGCNPQVSLCNVCDHLKENCAEVKVFDGKTIMACARCLERRANCGNCGRKIGRDLVQVGMCTDCMESMSRPGASERHFSQGLKWVSRDRGGIVKSTRIWSCELEALSPLRDYGHVLGKSLPQEMGIGTDGSVRGTGYGFEVQTPRIAGTKGEELIHRAVAAIKTVKPTLNETCGMHIHLDGDGIIPNDRRQYPANLVQLWKTYIAFEDVILSVLPYPRRFNDFCRPISHAFSLSQLDVITSTLDAEKLLYEERTYPEIRDAKNRHYHPSRYFGVNLHSLLAHGHLEIRFHSGTLNAKKILEWANLHTAIVDAAVNGALTKEFIIEAMSTSKLSDKTKMLFKAIGLSEQSQQYFFSRQKKFADKKVDEDEVKFENVPPRFQPVREEVESF